jgi:hypothetical protein
MSNRIYRPVGALLGISVAATLAFAQEGGSTHPCAAIAGDAARLACYDAAFGKPAVPTGATAATATTATAAAATPAIAAPPAAPTGVTAATAAAATQAAAMPAAVPQPAAAADAAAAGKARQEFGLSEVDKRALDPSKAAQEKPESITGTVASTGRRQGGEWVVTLEDGQVWVESQANPMLVLKPGDVVTIRKAALGSYMLVSPRRVATHVRRVK